MNRRRMRLPGTIFCLFVLVALLPGFQARKVEVTATTGEIESVGKDLQSIVHNGSRVQIASDTVIVDDSGKPLKAGDLNPKASVVVETVRTPNGPVAKKIVVKALKRKP